MADCDDTLRELQLFLDDELSAEQREHVREHLEECMECFHAFDFQAELKHIIAAKCRNDVMPPGLLERIRECFSSPAEATPADTTPAETS